MAHIRVRTGYAILILLLIKVCNVLDKYREYQSSIQTTEAMAAWDGLKAACDLFRAVVVDPRTMTE